MSIIEDYDHECEGYSALADRIEQLIGELLSAKKLRVHSVTTRVKAKDSLRNKLIAEPGKYSGLKQVTDVCGARIITYFEDEVDKIAALIENEFLVDPDNSIDKRQTLDVDRFGYASVHYVVRLHPRRANLSEYERFTEMPFEVQIRSILQHAWAEIEHDLQYKSKESVPRELRRRFARLAGLLEIADVEFRGIRDGLEDYRNRIIEELKRQPEIVLIDRESLTLFVRQSAIVSEVDQVVAGVMELPLTRDVTNPDLLASMLPAVGLGAIVSVEECLQHTKSDVVSFAAEFSRRKRFDSPATSVGQGISLLYLAYFLMTSRESVIETQELLDKSGIVLSGGTQELAIELWATRMSLEGT